MNWIYFAVGFWVGGLIGVFIAGIFSARSYEKGYVDGRLRAIVNPKE
jgi:Ni/Fe-hydrogenase subunit HybB-like protein